MCIVLTVTVRVPLAIARAGDPMVDRRDDSQVAVRADETLTRDRRCYSRISQIAVEPAKAQEQRARYSEQTQLSSYQLDESRRCG